MNAPDFTETKLAASCKLADAKYYAWHARELRAERDSQLSKLENQRISSGRVLKSLRLTSECLARGAREWVSIYEGVARERQCWEMLSKERLDEFRDRIMRSVGATLSSLRSRTKRAASAVGFHQSCLPPELRYAHVKAEILDVVNTEIALLEAEGNAHSEPADLNRVSKPDRKSIRKRLQPKPSVLPELGNVNKITAAVALGVTPRTVERMTDLPKRKTSVGNRYQVTDLYKVLNERGVRQAPTKKADKPPTKRP